MIIINNNLTRLRRTIQKISESIGITSVRKKTEFREKSDKDWYFAGLFLVGESSTCDFNHLQQGGGNRWDNFNEDPNKELPFRFSTECTGEFCKPWGGGGYSDRDKSWLIYCVVSQYEKSAKTYPDHCMYLVRGYMRWYVLWRVLRLPCVASQLSWFMLFVW